MWWYDNGRKRNESLHILSQFSKWQHSSKYPQVIYLFIKEVQQQFCFFSHKLCYRRKNSILGEDRLQRS